MKRLWAEVDQRLGCGLLLRACGERLLPHGAGWTKIWACVLGFAVVVQAITGFFLWMYYSPGAQTAWESVYYLQNEVTGGWLLRAVHHYSAHLTIALVMVYVFQMIFTASYRAPRELVFWSAIGVGLFALGAVLTGDLLYWDQNGYTSTKVRTSFLNLLPGVGQSLLSLATGGGATFGHLTLTRFFALHIGLLGGGMIAMVALHWWLVRRADTVEAETAAFNVPWWPGQAWRNAVACLAFMAIVFALSLQHGASGPHRGVFHGSPADPASSYDAARPEWMLVGVFEFSHLFPPHLAILPIFVLPGVVVAVMLAMPFLARSAVGQLFNLGIAGAVLVGLIGLTWHSYDKDRANPAHQAAIALEEELADRARELARRGIPPSGALTLLRGDAKVQGPKLFKQHCASCHNYSAPDNKAILAEKSSAPELDGFATRKWISGFLHPETIAGPDYFGNTAFAKEKDGMVDTVKGWWKEAGADKEELANLKKDLENAAIALSAEAQLKSQRAADAASAVQIKAGKEAITAMCVDCHRFHAAKGAGKPDLTGYGSREWLRAIIANPAHPRFYGKTNDRMPAYQDVVTQQELDLITDWLRGEWFEENL